MSRAGESKSGRHSPASTTRIESRGTRLADESECRGLLTAAARPGWGALGGIPAALFRALLSFLEPHEWFGPEAVCKAWTTVIDTAWKRAGETELGPEKALLWKPQFVRRSMLMNRVLGGAPKAESLYMFAGGWLPLRVHSFHARLRVAAIAAADQYGVRVFDLACVPARELHRVRTASAVVRSVPAPYCFQLEGQGVRAVPLDLSHRKQSASQRSPGPPEPRSAGAAGRSSGGSGSRGDGKQQQQPQRGGIAPGKGSQWYLFDTPVRPFVIAKAGGTPEPPPQVDADLEQDLVVARRGTVCTVWRLSSRKRLHDLRLPDAKARFVHADASAGLCVYSTAAGEHGSVNALSLTTGLPLHAKDLPIRGALVSFSPPADESAEGARSCLALAAAGDRVALWDVSRGRQLRAWSGCQHGSTRAAAPAAPAAAGSVDAGPGASAASAALEPGLQAGDPFPSAVHAPSLLTPLLIAGGSVCEGLRLLHVGWDSSCRLSPAEPMAYELSSTSTLQGQSLCLAADGALWCVTAGRPELLRVRFGQPKAAAAAAEEARKTHKGEGKVAQ